MFLFFSRLVQAVLKTWARVVNHVKFFGNVENSSIPVISLGIPNTKTGHCKKTLAMMKYIMKHFSDYKWLVIVDDDTILG